MKTNLDSDINELRESEEEFENINEIVDSDGMGMKIPKIIAIRAVKEKECVLFHLY